MTIESTGIIPVASQPAMFQSHRDAIQVPRDASRATWRHAQMALLAGSLWLLLAVVVTAAGDGAFGIIFLGTGVLWIWIAAVEAQDSRRPVSVTKKVHVRSRRQAMPSLA